MDKVNKKLRQSSSVTKMIYSSVILEIFICFAEQKSLICIIICIYYMIKNKFKMQKNLVQGNNCKLFNIQFLKKSNSLLKE